MQTCSNCGAAARPDARFCTSCGARLPLVQAGENTGWGESGDQPRQAPPWGANSANGHQGPSTNNHESPVTVTSSAADDQPSASTDNAPGAASPPWGQVSGDQSESGGSAEPASTAPRWSWGQSPQPDEATQGDAAANDERHDAGDEAGGASPSAEPSWISSWSGQGTGTSDASANEPEASAGAPGEATQSGAADKPVAASSGDTPGWSMPPSTTGATTPGDTTAATDDEAVANEQQGAASAAPDTRPDWMRDLTADQGGATEPTTAGQTAASADAPSFSAPAWSPADQSDAGADRSADAGIIAASQPGAATASTAPATSDALSEAKGLLDRLRELLPTLATPAAATPSVDASAIADQLQRALDQNARPEFDGLGGVLEAAQERPRDVDTMLGLVGKIDPLLALLHAHGNLVDAINGAISQLRDQSSGQ